jgi:hypothetical protein
MPRGPRLDALPLFVRNIRPAFFTTEYFAEMRAPLLGCAWFTPQAVYAAAQSWQPAAARWQGMWKKLMLLETFPYGRPQMPLSCFTKSSFLASMKSSKASKS